MYFRGEYDFLSNMYLAKMVYKQRVYPSAEHFFQCCKPYGEEDREFIRTAFTPGIAKSRGRQVQLRAGWNEKRVAFMRFALGLKFSQHRDLLTRLKAVEGEIIEWNSWGDTFWGYDVNKKWGENKLGILLMELRDK